MGIESDYLNLGSHSDQFVNSSGGGSAAVARWQLHQDTHSSGLPPGSFCHLSDNGTDFARGVGAQVRVGNIGARLEYEHFSIANTNGAQVFSPDAVISLL